MPQAQPQLQLVFGPLPAAWRGTPSDFKNQLQALAKITLPVGFLTGYVQEATPPNNSGLWFKPSTASWSYWNTNTNSWTLVPLGSDIGEIKWFAFSAVDLTKYVVCDGSAIPRITPYDGLYAKIGTSYGTGDGSTTFNVPDLRGRGLIGSGTGTIPGVGGAAAKPLTERKPGDLIGEEGHVLTAGELPTIHGSEFQSGGNNDLNILVSIKNNASDQQAPIGSNKSHNNIQPSTVAVAVIRYA